MQTRSPKVSVLIPVYNARPYLRETLSSILDQKGCDFEVAIADDGSTDGSLESVEDLLDRPFIRVLRHSNRGKAATLNRLLSGCDSDYVAVQDADDVAHPMRLAAQARALDESPRTAAVFCGYDLLVRGRRMAPVSCRKDERDCARDVALFRMPSHDPTAMYRLQTLSEVRYSEDLRIVEGLDLVLRLGERHPLRCIPDLLYGYRIHAGSATRSDSSRRNQLVREALSRACARRGIDPSILSEIGIGPGPDSADDVSNNLHLDFCTSAATLRASGRVIEALGAAWDSIALDPWSRRQYRAVVHALAPPRLAARRRSRREDAQIAALERARTDRSS